MGRGGQRESRCGAKEVGGNAEMLGDEGTLRNTVTLY